MAKAIAILRLTIFLLAQLDISTSRQAACNTRSNSVVLRHVLLQYELQVGSVLLHAGEPWRSGMKATKRQATRLEAIEASEVKTRQDKKSTET